jgi:hypothetical protein
MRACVLGLVALTSGVIAHAAAGAPLPPTWALLLLLALVTVVAEPLLRHPASTRRVVLLLVGGEMFIHLALSVMNRLEQSGVEPMAGMHHGSMHMGEPGPPAGIGSLPHLVAGLTSQDALMADAHLVAMAVVGWWLAAGERALWTLFACAVRPVAHAVEVVLSAPTWVYAGEIVVRDLRLVAEEGQRRPGLSVSASREVTRRGPPALWCPA